VPFAVELWLDRESAAAVRSCWAALASAGLRRAPAGDPEWPHVSLAIYQAFDVKAGGERLRRWAERHQPVPVRFHRLQVFSAEAAGVLFLDPGRDDALTRLHRRLQHVLEPSSHGLWDNYRESRWVPHCTLADHLDAAHLHRAQAMAGAMALPLSGTLEAVALVAFDDESRHTQVLVPLGPAVAPASEVDAAWRRFDEALAAAHYFEAHDLLEALWRRERDSRQQAAIWVAAAFHHAGHRNFPGASRLLQKIQDRVGHDLPEPLMAAVAAWRACVERGDVPVLADADRRRLVQWAKRAGSSPPSAE
jgi:2'-5' RNA ligase